MSSTPKQQFMPFFKVKAQLKCMRLSLGFPLKAEDESLVSYEFGKCLEMMRYLMYLIIVVGSCLCCILLLFTADRKTNNCWTMFTDDLKSYGFSGLDIAVISLLPVLNIISNTIHLISFRSEAKKLSKVNAMMSLINEDLHKLLGNDLFDSFENKSALKGWNLVVFFLYISLIPMVASAMISVALSAIIFQSKSGELSMAKKVMFTTFYSIFTVSYMYPPTSASADFVVYVLLKEAKGLCEKFKIAIVLRENLESYADMNGSGTRTILR